MEPDDMNSIALWVNWVPLVHDFGVLIALPGKAVRLTGIAAVLTSDCVAVRYGAVFWIGWISQYQRLLRGGKIHHSARISRPNSV